MASIEGRSVLVTGGQRGLGAAFTAELLTRGASRVVVTARDPRPSQDDRIVPMPLEVTDDRSVTALAAAVPDVSVVFNNAGIGGGSSVLTAPMADIEAVLATNVLGAVRVARAFAPVLARHDDGVLVNIASVLSWLAGTGAYGASKAALWSLSNSLRLELAPQGTEVVGVHLGLADTALTARFGGAAKLDPAVVASAVLDGVERGDAEILVDEASRAAKSMLAGPVEDLVARL